MKNFYKASLITLLSIFIWENANAFDNILEFRRGGYSADGEHEIFSVSIIELISRPEIYNAKHIRIVGYIRLDFEGTTIYLSKNDYLHGITRNGLWLNLDTSSINKNNIKHIKNIHNKYVILEGVFNSTQMGHGSLFSGSIDNITRIDHWR